MEELGDRREADALEVAPHESLTRRVLLWRGGQIVFGASAVSALLAGCGGGGAAPADSVKSSEASGKVGGSLDFLSWEGYDLPDAMAAWNKANEVKIRPTYIGTHDDIQGKLLAGSTGTDLITYVQNYQPLYSELKLLQPLDEERLPNLAGLFPFFKSKIGNFWVDGDGTRTGVPLSWGLVGLTYDTEALTTPPTSYDVLFEPKFKGKVAMPDEPNYGYGLAAKILGFDGARMTQDQFEETTDYLRRLVAQTRGISASYGDVATRLAAGDAVICFAGWAAINSFAADAGKTTIDTVLPKEGGLSFCDAYAIPPGADNADTAYGWINEALTPEVSAAANDFLAGGTPVAAAVALLDEKTRSLYDYDNLEQIFEAAPFPDRPPLKSDEFVTIEQITEGWQALKAGA